MEKYDPHAATGMFPEDGWFKATASEANGTGCVTVNLNGPSGTVGLRDSKQPEAGTFMFTAQEWGAFLAGAKGGEFDLSA